MTLYAAYGTNLDPGRMGERCPHSPLATTGWLTGLAADLRRRGARLGRRPVDDRRGPARAGLRRGLRRHPRGRGRPRRLGGRRLRASTARPRSGSPPSPARWWSGPTCSTPTRAGCPRRRTSACSPTPPRPPTPRPTTCRPPRPALPLDRAVAYSDSSVSPGRLVGVPVHDPPLSRPRGGTRG